MPYDSQRVRQSPPPDGDIAADNGSLRYCNHLLGYLGTPEELSLAELVISRQLYVSTSLDLIYKCRIVLREREDDSTQLFQLRYQGWRRGEN